MIIIIEKGEVIANRVSIVHQASIEHVGVEDLVKSDRLTLQTVALCDLLILTDKEEKKFRVFKDRYCIFELDKVYKLDQLEKWLRNYCNVWLWNA